MRWMFLKMVFCVLAVGPLASLAADAPVGQLNYRAVIQIRGEAQPITTRFVLTPASVVATRNRTKRPRMTRWQVSLVGDQVEGLAQAALLARIERLLYFSAPVPGMVRTPVYIHFDRRRCQVWQIQPLQGLQAYAYLVEAAPGLLALSYLSGTFEKGDLASVEIHLEDFRLQRGAAPAEDGTVLLATLKRMALAQTAPTAPATEGLVEVIE